MSRLRAAAIVFDCDGLLVETESRWTIAERSLVERHGGSWSAELKSRILGRSLSDAGIELARWLGLGDAAGPLLARELETEYSHVLAREGAPPLPGARALVDALAGKLPLAVASNTRQPYLDRTLAASGLPDVWDAVVASGGELRPKPAPDVYLHACAAIGVEPGRAVAFEDSPTGVASARAAGMRVVGVPSLPGTELEADVVLSSLEHAHDLVEPDAS